MLIVYNWSIRWRMPCARDDISVSVMYLLHLENISSIPERKVTEKKIAITDAIAFLLTITYLIFRLGGMGRKGITKYSSRMALALAEGVFSQSVDFTLWLVAYVTAISAPQRVYGQAWRAQITADRFLNQVNYNVIKDAIQRARKQGWVKTVHRSAHPEITAEGKRRLSTILPHYDEKRVWDGRMHTVIYDIPEKSKRHRELLREYLRRIGCGRLQDSVWMTPYNPIDTIRGFVGERGLNGTIIVSDVGSDGSIGEEDLRSLIVRVYRLEGINDLYEAWLKEVDEEGGVDHRLVLRYLSILKYDPQLPFALLPKWWKGDEAYEKVKSLLLKLSIEKL